ncbi:MAG: tRNA (cytidine(34)-2'-O)-methyltransferase [Hyphomicrobiaceae bacterium]|nr:tRNA (cytidine(34)-2'-O)-methyltransferase [Hyphomicrobiaceae bacterium]
MKLALYQPDIPQNTGAILRLGACLDIAVHIIEPTGFDISNRTLKRTGLDYLKHAHITRHVSFDAFEAWRTENAHRLVLLTTTASTAYTDITYRTDDILMLGRESAGAPDEVHGRADERVRVPMAEGLRSLNIVTAAAIVLGEALRQTGGFPETRPSA